MAASVRLVQSRNYTARALLCSMAATYAYCYASLSVIGENPGLGRLPRDTLEIILDSGKFKTISDLASPEEFLHSRRQLFRFDATRFPAYFKDYSRRDAARLFTPSIVKRQGSTEFLEQYLVLPEAISPHLRAGSPALVSEAEDLISRTLSTRDGRAIIYPLFRDRAAALGDEAPYVSHGIRRSISAAYGLNMVRARSGMILVGHNRLSYYDQQLTEGCPAIDIHAVEALLGSSSAAFWHGIASGDVFAWDSALKFLLGQYGDLPAMALWTTMDSVVQSSPDGDVGIWTEGLKLRVRRACRAVEVSSDQWQTNCLKICEKLIDHGRGKELATRMKRIVITYANEREYLGILDGMSLSGDELHEPVFEESIGYDRLPDVHGNELFLVQTEAGSVGAGSAQATIQDAIDHIRPDIVAAVGVAFDLSGDQDIDGVVLIGSRLRVYERVRLGSTDDGEFELRERGEARDMDPILLQRLRMVARKTGVGYKVGEIASGEKLVDWPPFRSELQARFPDAIGGEMELAGIVAACTRKRVNWMFLKAVSDRGDGRKKKKSKNAKGMAISDDDRQRAGAKNAMLILLAYLNAV